MPTKKENSGCGCASVPFSVILVMLGVGYWGFRQQDSLDISKFYQLISPQLLIIRLLHPASAHLWLILRFLKLRRQQQEKLRHKNH
ncbi:MAG: hypothetical protein KME01_09090 [Chroococcus sp. CMT-3BRIN-NPC107]|nr:hypothetical protein [Chroococcus sp. CMT-3BRIN-NPC107]